jgi:pimeloyl-ACP methyl ester carboxylesterase
MEFTDERTQDGVTRRSFSLMVDGETVPAVIWAPEGASDPRPLVLMGHGGSQHKKTPTLSTRARTYARKFGYATLAIDAPGHGDRISRQEALALARETGARVRGEAPSAWTTDRLKLMGERTKRAVPEWNAALEAALSFDFVGEGLPIGYWGVSMGTAIGVPFVAQQPRITAAVLGLAGLRRGDAAFEAGARRITIPVEFVFQWDDAVAPRDLGVGLFEALASKEKTMHVNPGGHLDTPDFEGASWERFFVRHLGTAASPAVRQRAAAAE